MAFAKPSLAQDESLRIDSVNALGSPAKHDMNGDGVLDILLATGIEFKENKQGLICIDGATWEVLWRAKSRDQLFSQPVFFDANLDGTDDLVVGGRKAQFMCIDGRNGDLLWELVPDSIQNPRAQGWYQFYTPLLLNDFFGNGKNSLLVMNGGGPPDTLGRPASTMILLDAENGSILWSDTVADNTESYSSLIRWQGPDGDYVVYGTGGERFGGNLWRVSLDSLLTNGLSSSVLMIADSSKGFVPVPSMADLNSDGYDELLVSSLSQGLMAYDAVADSLLWKVPWGGYECYTSPAVGYFNEDNVPDVVSFYQKGVFPFYGEFVLVVVDGLDGSLLHSDSSGWYQYSKPNVLDVDGDGSDEILYLKNWDRSSTIVEFVNALFVVDPARDSTWQLTQEQIGIQAFSSNLLWDLNRDSVLEIVVVRGLDKDSWYVPDALQVAKIELDFYDPCPAWGSYLGNEGDGRFESTACPMISSIQLQSKNELRLFPNPIGSELSIQGLEMGENWFIFSAKGDVIRSGNSNGVIDLSGLAPGLYHLRSQFGASAKLLKLD